MEKIEPIERPTSAGKLGAWQTVIIVLATWLVSTAVNWGVVQARQEESQRRQNATDAAIAQLVPRTEYDSWRQELDHRLDRLEEKIDTLLGKR